MLHSWLDLLGRPLDWLDELAVWAILWLVASSFLCSLLLSLLGVVILLEVLLGHFPLNDHETRVDERLFEQLALEHPHQVLYPDVLSRWSLYYASVCSYLLLLGQGLLRICLTLLGKSSLMLREELG